MPVQILEPTAPWCSLTFAPEPEKPIQVHFRGTNLEILLVEKEMVPRAADAIPRDWATVGVYVLLGRPTTAEAVVTAYPGYTGDMLKRLREHTTKNEWYTRAVLARDRELWESGHARYLEGRLHDLCEASNRVDHLGRNDHDDTLMPATKERLERQGLPGIVGVLNFIGVPIAPNWHD
jgi:hypothetical protein